MRARAAAVLVGDARAVQQVSAVAALLQAGGWDVDRGESAAEAVARPGVDLVLCADRGELARLAADRANSGRLCPVVAAEPARLTREAVLLLPPDVVAASRLVVCADETTRGLVDSLVPGAAGRTVVLDVAASPTAPGVVPGLDDVRRRVRPEDGGLWREGRPLRVVVAGHALHFLAAVIDHLEASPDVDLRVDHVRSFVRHDEARSAELARWADVVFCEWCSPVAIWYSRNKRPGQRLLVRLHRYELYREWPAQVEIDAVDQVVCVSPHYARLTREVTGWPTSKVTVVPNYVDVSSFARPKRIGAQYCLGFLGILPPRKRVDLALDVLERLRGRDPRYSLSVKTRMPWDSWNRGTDEEVEYVRSILGRAATSAELLDGVSWEPYGGDVAAWLTGVGFVLSTSDDESFHLSPAEGMASGALPAVLHWPGAETIYDGRWIHESPDAIAEWVDHVVRSGTWWELSALAEGQVRASFDVPVVSQLIRRLLLPERLPPGPEQR